jgi:hypothetical protein
MVRPWQEPVPPPPPASVTHRIEFPSEDEETGEVRRTKVPSVDSIMLII